MIARPYNTEEPDDPYSGFSDSNADQPDQPPEPAGEQPTEQRAEQPKPAPAAPKPYTPPATVTHDGEPAPVRTFAQIEQQGQARPPMPEPEPIDTPAPFTPYAQPEVYTPQDTPPPRSGELPAIDASVPTPYDLTPSDVGGMTGDSPAQALPDVPVDMPAPFVPPTLGVPGPIGTDVNVPVDLTGKAPIPQRPDVAPTDTGGMIATTPGGASPLAPPTAPASTPPAASNPILDLLTGGATGGNKTDLQKATEAKAMSQLNGASPYDSKAVRDEYDYLAGNIDDQYTTDTRHLDDSFAQRGLYGSAGKDFHSGRLSDLNVGKRSAKIALGQDLANKFATTKGQYDANAINQAENVGQTDQANRFGYLQNLMGYGNDAFSHDLQTAQFQQNQNESDQDYLLRLLSLGYGV